MKYRYIIWQGFWWGTDELTRDHLVRLKNGVYEGILDLQEWKYFDADENNWMDMDGDK